MGIDVKPLAIPEVKLITPQRFGDHRGFFEETYNRDSFAVEGISLDFVQDNHSLSAEAGTIRGLHFQAPPRAQDKLVRCGRGRLFDVAVDIRTGSPTYGKWVGEELSFANGRMLLVPAGFAHGFLTLEPATEIVYKCSDTYAPETEGALRWDDPGIGIGWPDFDGAPQLSGKDAVAPVLADIDSPFTFEA
ncbi:dTDP-4-dehydrorhamnose 3,5-epimerase [Tropicimonas sp. TH_r6]|uniref:dTDP-4-dehydrorhamnose 3,5-epimerase n=1 Tax=Tropicimonas sp. TH_r6 TaxID=3082085 RepID=UPI002955CDEC|nr:dTDP-4-dehydrorhamnose 3,5-epimerase [Tropicimonas sp. TH_r6]MDV7141156.1 dTDP-4-dehydrorhamnose 3,5-epimerase [Tropicimonas sp. TH_r6]